MSVNVPVGLEGVLTNVLVTPSVSLAGDQATVGSLVPVPGREATNASLVKRAGDSMTGDLNMDRAAVALKQGDTTRFTVRRDAATDTFILADGAGIDRLTMTRPQRWRSSLAVKLLRGVAALTALRRAWPGRVLVVGTRYDDDEAGAIWAATTALMRQVATQLAEPA